MKNGGSSGTSRSSLGWKKNGTAGREKRVSKKYLPFHLNHLRIIHNHDGAARAMRFWAWNENFIEDFLLHHYIHSTTVSIDHWSCYDWVKKIDHFGCIGRHSFVPVLGSKDEWWIGWQVILQQDVMEDLSFNQLSKGSNGHRIIFNSVSLFWTFALELLKNSKLYVEQDFFVLERHSNDVFYNFSFLNSIEYSWKKLKKFFRCLMNSNAT